MNLSWPIISLLALLLSNNSFAFELSQQLKLEPGLRYRHQQVNDPVRGDATADTLKLRLSADWQVNDNWKSFAQFDHVQAFNEDSYNSITVTRATSPIPDPSGSELNQLYLQYKSDGNWSASLGRQSIGFDNERHIGKIEFWQNDQNFDALSWTYQDNLHWTLHYVYLNKVHRIFGDDATEILPLEDIRFSNNPNRPPVELGNHKQNSHLINLKYSLNRTLKVTVFSYLLDNQTSVQQATKTYGLRASGKFKPRQLKYAYTVEVAQQKGAFDNPWSYTAPYYLAEFSSQYKSHQLQLSYERLEQDNGFVFDTSLGTNHKFQGWADVFSGYRLSAGLEDKYITYRGRNGKIRWRVVAHQFTSVEGDIRIGKEFDVELAYRYNRQWEFKLIAAKYMADKGLANSPTSQQDLSTWSVSVAYNL